MCSAVQGTGTWGWGNREGIEVWSDDKCGVGRRQICCTPEQATENKRGVVSRDKTSREVIGCRVDGSFHRFLMMNVAGGKDLKENKFGLDNLSNF